MKWVKTDIAVLLLFAILFRYMQIKTTYSGSIETLSMLDFQIFSFSVFMILFLTSPVVFCAGLLWVVSTHLPKRLNEKQKMKILLEVYKDEFGKLPLNKLEDYRGMCA